MWPPATASTHKPSPTASAEQASSRTSPHLSLVAEALRLDIGDEEADALASWFLDTAAE